MPWAMFNSGADRSAPLWSPDTISIGFGICGCRFLSPRISASLIFNLRIVEGLKDA
jgi:hypothetical protein